jgi:hypothetical protein
MDRTQTPMTEPAPREQDAVSTKLAIERTRMAEERTFASWVRTGLALVAGGLASARLLTAVQPEWLVRAMGTIFILLGGAIFALAFRTSLREPGTGPGGRRDDLKLVSGCAYAAADRGSGYCASARVPLG